MIAVYRNRTHWTKVLSLASIPYMKEHRDYQDHFMGLIKLCVCSDYYMVLRTFPLTVRCLRVYFHTEC